MRRRPEAEHRYKKDAENLCVFKHPFFYGPDGRVSEHLYPRPISFCFLYYIASLFLIFIQVISELAESKKWTLLNVAADLEISQEMINTHEEFLITVVSNDTVLGSIILPAWHSIFQSGEYVGKYLHIGGWYHNAENCGMIQIYKFRDIGWTTNPDLHCCSVNGQYVTVNIALFGR